MEDDALDSKSFLFKGDGNLVATVSPAVVSRSAEYYDMNHKNRGTALIFNHKEFKSSLEVPTRQGTDVDCDRLHSLLKKLGFKVKAYHNLTYYALKEKLNKARDEDHNESDCFVCVVLSHGDDGVMYSYDRKYSTSDLWTPFLAHNCPSLLAKPKLFFLQACQGTQLDDGVPALMTDSAQQIRLPSHADFLVAYSTVPALCTVIASHYESEDLLSLLTMVNRAVAFDFESSTADLKMHQKKQVPYITSMLTRKVFFGKQ